MEQEIIYYSFKTSFFDIFVSDLGDPGGRGGARARPSSSCHTRPKLIRETWLPSSGSSSVFRRFPRRGPSFRDTPPPRWEGKTRPLSKDTCESPPKEHRLGPLSLPGGGDLGEQDWRGRPAISRGRAIGWPLMPPHPAAPQVLAFFRFSGLLLGYAVLRLRHWWVIAVRCHFPGSSRALAGLVKAMGRRRTHSSASVSPLPPRAGHHTGVQCIPHCQGHPL